MFECRIKRAEYPEDGDIVMVRITAIRDDLVTVKLLEYGEIEGLIMGGELSKKKYRSIYQVVKVGNAELCQVLKVDKTKGHIDLSLKRVGDRERMEGREKFSRSKMAYQIMQKVSKIINKSIKELYEEFGYDKEANHGTLFTFFARLKDDPELLGEGELISKVILKIPSIEDILSCFVILRQLRPFSKKDRVEIINEIENKAETEEVLGLISRAKAFYLSESGELPAEVVLSCLIDK